MANEPSPISISSVLHPVRRTVADTPTIEKYTYLKLADPNTASAATGTGDVFGGIAAFEKVASDGSTNLSAYMDGVFDLYASGATIAIGAAVTNSGANVIRTATEAEIAAGQWCGWAEEASASATPEMIRVRLRGEGI